IAFGNGQNGADPNALFFAAGINDENDGVFGKVTFSDGDHDREDGDAAGRLAARDGTPAAVASPGATAQGGDLGPDGRALLSRSAALGPIKTPAPEAHAAESAAAHATEQVIDAVLAEFLKGSRD